MNDQEINLGNDNVFAQALRQMTAAASSDASPVVLPSSAAPAAMQPTGENTEVTQTGSVEERA